MESGGANAAATASDRCAERGICCHSPARRATLSLVTTSTLPSASAATRYEAVIGIECHVQLRTASKMFCGCSTDFQDARPNSHTCPVCLAMPGTLPVINRQAVRHVLATGIAIGATIPAVTRWDRKNYFYPDLPKGYQISQYDLPLAEHGTLTVDTSAGPFTVGITRAHLEEDTARLGHVVLDDGRPASLVDFNRAGTPLLEIVTDPVIRTAEQARRYAEELRLLLVTIGASDAAMEDGQMRVEANVSLRPVGTEAFGTRIEVKNMNSFRSVERAIEFEIERQTRALETGEPLIQETRGWDDDRGVTYRMRVKESSDDYRYFPDPDLPPLRVDGGWLETIRVAMPELPAARRERYVTELGLAPADAVTIVAGGSDYFERAVSSRPGLDARRTASLYTEVGLRAVKGDPTLLEQRDPAELGRVSQLTTAGELTGANAKEAYQRHLETGETIDAIVAAAGYQRISDAGALRTIVEGVLAANPAAVADVQAGKAQAMGFLTGQVMKQTRGQADAATVGALLRELLGQG
ncbi:MAG: Asp-tRNA(Asn)/Glu-tRNA(Gln) amidotransferase subunit GatB [Chloroflexi bacterium]|nr:Asp-tRNA(Asn)/Glu-tRNA(Gln) amidotransferase subunit GatB [Chloroflexota bacterium]